MIVHKLRELYPDFDAKQYIRDLENHIIYKHDESGFAGAISPYCCSISMYPFLTNGIKDIGGLSAAPKNLDSYCGMYINLIFAVAAQFAGAVATSEFLLYFDLFARKEWGDNYYQKADVIISSEHCLRKKTIQSQIHQYFQQVIYSINQPAAARGMQSAFVNFSLFDKNFFDGMFDNFYFPDGSKPIWESLNWLQKDFLHWFNQERLRCILTFPVVSCTLLYKDGEFKDIEFYDFLCEEYAQGNSFFTYISNTVDSLSSCCRLKNKIQTKEFNFTNGNMGVETGSKSVISLNLNRIIQDFCRAAKYKQNCYIDTANSKEIFEEGLKEDLKSILNRVYKYQEAYNELLWDMYNSDLLPVYKAGFIDLNKQYLTIGLIGTSAAAEFLGIDISDNPDYQSSSSAEIEEVDQDKIEIKDIDIKAEYTNVSSVLSPITTNLRDKDLFEVVKFTIKLEAVHQYIWDVYHKPSEIRENFENIISELDKNHIIVKGDIREMLTQISTWTNDGIQIHISDIANYYLTLFKDKQIYNTLAFK
jgi:ribonucleoside-triphosphate reductase